MRGKIPLSLPELASNLAALATNRRVIVAIAGAPGSGKSTIAAALAARLTRIHAARCQILPMDGFHYDDEVLKARDLLQRKGAPETFDLDGLDAALSRIGAADAPDMAVPVFDRRLEISRAGARIIRATTSIVLVEGNYMLFDTAPWGRLARHFTTSVAIGCDIDLLRDRLMQRWLDHGKTPDDARAKVEQNDIPNARLVAARSRMAEFELRCDVALEGQV